MPYKDKQDLYSNHRKRREANKRKLCAYLMEHPCVDCNESDLVVLEFDHVHGTKSGTISKWINTSTRKWETILMEIEKCEVRCANCHRRKTYRQFNRTKYAPVAQLG